jgi:hypothetical protein
MAEVPEPVSVADMRRELDQRLHSLYIQIATRLDAMEKATAIFSDDLRRVPTLLDRDMARIAELYKEKFSSIQMQFDERDVRRTQERHANEATAEKTERGVTKEIDSLKIVMATNRTAMDDKLQDIAGRLNRTESAAVVVREVRQDTAMSVGTILGIVGLCVSFVSIMIVVVLTLYTGRVPTTPVTGAPDAVLVHPR